MAKHHKGKKLSVPLGEAIFTIVKANLMAYAVTIIFIILGAIILTYTKGGAGLEKIVVLTGILLSSFLAGFDTAKIETRNGYKWGAIGGTVYLILFLVAMGIFNGLKDFQMGTFFVIMLLGILSSTLAGMISVNSSK